MFKVYSVRIQNPDTKEIPKVAIIVRASNAMQAIHKVRIAKGDDKYLDPLLLVKCKEIQSVGERSSPLFSSRLLPPSAEDKFCAFYIFGRAWWGVTRGFSVIYTSCTIFVAKFIENLCNIFFPKLLTNYSTCGIIVSERRKEVT